MKNKKGFTLIELLAVVLIIGVLLIIAVPQVMKFMKKGTNSYYHSIENTMKTSGMDYMETYRTLLPREIGNVAVVSLDELMDNDYIDKVKDEKGNLCTGQVAVKKVKKDSYEYYSCLKCGEYYESSEQDCSYNELNNHYADAGEYSIVVNALNKPEDPNCDLTKYQACYIANQLEEVTSPYGKVLYKGTPIKDDLKGNPTKVDTTKQGEHEITYFYHGTIAKILITIKDNDAPSKPQIVLKTNNAKGKTYKGNWYSGDIYVKFKSTDYATKGVTGSGIDHYEISDDGTTFTPISGNSVVMTEEGAYTKYVRSVDKDGNISAVNSYEIKIDKTEPNCEQWLGESTVWKSTGDRNIKLVCSDDVSDCLDKYKTQSIKVDETIKTKQLTFTITDLAGNSKTCTKEADIYIDKVKPTITSNEITGINYTTNKHPIEYFTVTPSISPIVNTKCVVEDNRTPNPANGTEVNDIISLKSNYTKVKCTVTSESGLSSSSITDFRHEYAAVWTQRTCQQWVTRSCKTSVEYFWCCPGVCGDALCSRYEYEDCSGWENYDCSRYECPQGGTLDSSRNVCVY